jgi:hypothetical protein
MTHTMEPGNSALLAAGFRGAEPVVLASQRAN